MKAFTALILAIMLVSVIASTALAAGDVPSVGVKEGDWMEYAVSVTGPTWTPSHNISWFKIEILNVEEAAFQANVTVKNVNGTFSSSVWKFNFTEGQVEGWVIIPSNLSAGNTFFDGSKPGNVTILGEEQKNVAGAPRTVTYASDSKRLVKEWDMATGVYTYSEEHPKNLTVISTAVATNMWSSQSLQVNQTLFFGLAAAGIMLATLVVCSVLLVLRKKSVKTPTLPHPLQRKQAAIEVFIVLLLAVEAIAVSSFVWSEFGLTAAGVNLVMQTFWTSLVLVSMWFRKKANYFLHGIIMMMVVGATLVSFSSVLLMSPPSGGSMEVYFSSPVKIAEFVSHGFLSIPAIIFGVWLVAL
jgi:hypothetical protein